MMRPIMSSSFNSLNDFYAKELGEEWLPYGANKTKSQEIKDLPVMMTNDGTVVCIPKLADMGLIAGVGMPGVGKTLGMGYLVDNIFYNWQDYVSLINDSQEESFTWSEPQDVPEFIYKIKQLNQNPIPLPMIYLFPNSEKYQDDPDLVIDKNSLLISLPFEEVINNIDKYIPDLGKSQKYIEEKKQDLLAVESKEQLRELVQSINTGTKGMDAVVRKLEAAFESLINEGILNISNPSIPSYLTIKCNGKEIYSGNPFTALMLAECIPSFVTSTLITQSNKDAIFSYYISELFRENKTGAMKGRRVWLYCDELTNLVHTDPQKSLIQTEKELNNLAARGRNNGISLIYATQGYNEIPHTIRNNTKFAVIFRHKTNETSKLICADFALDKETKDEILRLRKFEAVIATTEYVVCYKGNKRWEERKPLKGVILPPLHKNKFLNKLIYGR